MNKSILLLTASCVLLLPVILSAQSDLTQYRHKRRLLVIFAPSRRDERWEKQNVLLADSAEAFHNRDLLRLDYLETEKAKGEALRKRYGIKSGQFRVLLIGRDGHVALGGPAPISLSDLTRQIDRMPMRREEMRRHGR